MSIDHDLQNDFPILKRKINGKRLVYLDNAATSQKPQVVIDSLVNFYSEHNANVHRGIHTLSEEATKMYEEARGKIARFINARHPEELIFTRGTTESLNLVAKTWGELNIDSNSEILASEIEHHSNLVPWQQLAKSKKAVLLPMTINDEGFVENFKKEINSKTKIVALSHASNVFGTIQNIKEIAKEVHKNGGVIVVDGAQAIPHLKVDVQSMNCDFYAFSGHKMLGPTGIGVLYVKKEVLEKMQPYEFGGGMIREVAFENTTFADLPSRFEAGTPNVADAIGLGTAIDYINKVGIENIRNHELDRLKYAFTKLSEVEGIKIYGPKDLNLRTGVISFTIEGIHPHDLASVLDTEGVAIRSGHHCTMPLHRKLNIPATARASYYLYNTDDDTDVLISGIEKAKRILLQK